jgi:putative transport protein
VWGFLAAQPVLLLALLVLIGSTVGSIRIAGAYLGPAAVLFAALALTAGAATQGVELQIPETLGNFGLVLFTYAVGVASGPSFFGSLRQGWPTILSSVGCLAGTALVGGVAGWALGLPAPVTAGAFAGALTNTPALAAAGQIAGDAEAPALAYSITYLWGVIGLLLAAAWALKRPQAGEGAALQLERRTIRVDRSDGPTVAEALERYAGQVVFSRIGRGGGDVVVATPARHLRQGDLVSVIGPEPQLDRVTAELGHVSGQDLTGDRSQLDYARVTLSRTALVGSRLVDLELNERFGAQVSRVRRGDVDLIAAPGLVVYSGDRLRVIAPRQQMKSVRSYLGDSERGFSDINPVGLALGLTVGVLLGLVHWPLPGGGLSLGSAAGTLIAGLVCGRLGRIGPVVTSMATSAAHTLSSLGMLVFLAYAGTKAGAGFTAAVSSELGWRVALLGGLITSTAALALLAAGRWLHRTPWPQLAGQLGGAQTQPAVLAFANTRSNFDTRVGLGYALVYPAAMMAKIVLAQLLVILG